METLSNLESFVRSAEGGSFSAAARRLALSPAAVSRNVAILERNLGVRLFQRSTRKLTLTEAGEAFLASIRGNLESLQNAISAVSADNGEPAGMLKVSLPPSLGIDYFLPLLPEFLLRYPRIRPEWHFENRIVDLIAEGYDAAIGGGFDLMPGVVSRTLAPLHVIAVASPEYFRQINAPVDPSGLVELDCITLRSLSSGRIRSWRMRNAAGEEHVAHLAEGVVVNDPPAARQAARLGLGVALLAVSDVLPWLESGELIRVLPRWWGDAGALSLYYAGRELLPSKTRVFIDFVVESFEREDYARRFAGSVS
ncbi:LysR family transcriptional regulator [Massilia sp. CFBP9012]|uniref:LysR family transcriptional regulator n=1 Tax=Massilia sp. CFBP9012 TaxID=3096531 RepID=UPI002A6A37CF|nr:LysR family transcriptional regulator [Massilia sp. CFBP9012]MDY0975918.1 LysR family transcriptional regulator [Massilia sp. CFBP9012]